jgi:outer membrane immunogenic protein
LRNNSLSAAIPSTTTPSIFNTNTSLDTDWLFTSRGRLGWAATPRLLLYATGGLAVTNLKVGNSFVTSNNPANTSTGASSQSETRAGWTVGAGTEWAFYHNWTLKAEYLYVNFRSISTTAFVNSNFATPDVFTTSADLKANIVRVGLNYKFGYAAAPAVYR